MSDIFFLFRFRDLVAPTIQEHQRIINKHGWCWWGWWKRPSEDTRKDMWDALEQQTPAGKSVEVGLFDSGTGKVYRAFVTGVKKPAGENATKITGGESHYVPSYYRKSPFSRGWMKIKKIDLEPIDFFDKYSFTEVPQLPNYAHSTLRRFQDKKIVNADELRGMDTTIWRIRPSLPTDHSEQILLSAKGITDPISVEVVRCKSDEVLHLTDAHFAMGKNRGQHIWRYDKENGSRNTMVEAITAALGERKIGLVIISGDFTFIGCRNEFAEAGSAIQHLLGILDLSADHLVIVPGNHDIQWTTKADYNHNAEVVEVPEVAKRNYKEFYYQLLRHQPNPHLSMGRRFALPSGMTIEICGINSSSLETGPNFLAGMGRVDEAAFEEVANRLGWTNTQTLALRLLVIHHHLALMENLEPTEGYGKGYGLAVDAVRVQRMAAESGVHLALHGHKHRSFVWRSTVYHLPEHTHPKYRLGELSIVGGGSAGSTETERSSNFFNVIAIKPAGINLEIFRSESRGKFGVMQKWNAELFLSKETGGLKLADWQVR